MKFRNLDRRKKIRLLLAGILIYALYFSYTGYKRSAIISRVEAKWGYASYSYIGEYNQPRWLKGFINTCLFGIWPKEVTWITLQVKPFEDGFISDLSSLTSLRHLIVENCNIAGSKIKDIKPLGNLTKLVHLSLNNNNVTDLSALKSLTDLRSLYLEDNPNLTLVEINKLQKALPSCRIKHNATK